VSGGEPEKSARAVAIANEAAGILATTIRVSPDDLRGDDDQIGAGYGIRRRPASKRSGCWRRPKQSSSTRSTRARPWPASSPSPLRRNRADRDGGFPAHRRHAGALRPCRHAGGDLSRESPGGGRVGPRPSCGRTRGGLVGRPPPPGPGSAHTRRRPGTGPGRSMVPGASAPRTPAAPGQSARDVAPAGGGGGVVRSGGDDIGVGAAARRPDDAGRCRPDPSGPRSDA
jgi:hypothetical protein